MTFLNPTDSLRNLTSAMGKKEKFSYINVPKSSIVALSKNSENPFPANFAKNIISSLKNNDKRSEEHTSELHHPSRSRMPSSA